MAICVGSLGSYGCLGIRSPGGGSTSGASGLGLYLSSSALLVLIRCLCLSRAGQTGPDIGLVDSRVTRDGSIETFLSMLHHYLRQPSISSSSSRTGPVALVRACAGMSDPASSLAHAGLDTAEEVVIRCKMCRRPSRAELAVHLPCLLPWLLTPLPDCWLSPASPC